MYVDVICPKEKSSDRSPSEQWRQLEEEEDDKKEKDKDKDYEVEEVSELEEEFQPTGEVAESPASLQTQKPATPTPPSTPTPTPPTTPIPSRPTSTKKPPQPLMTPLKPAEIEAVHRQQLEVYTKVGFYLMLTFFRR